MWNVYIWFQSSLPEFSDTSATVENNPGEENIEYLSYNSTSGICIHTIQNINLLLGG